MHGSPISLRRTSFGSPFSQHHPREMVLSSVASPLDSPVEGFRIPQWTPLSHGASVEDFIAAATEPPSRTPALTLASEACVLSGITNATSSSSIMAIKDVLALKPPRSYLCRSFRRHCLSKFGSRHLLCREKVDGCRSFQSFRGQNRTFLSRSLSENGYRSLDPAGGQHEDSVKQPMTLSQLVASSTREAFGWSDVNSISQLSWTLDEEGSNTCVGTSFERIRADTFLHDESNGVESEDVLEMCSICSKSLMERSPWSSQRYVGSNDLPVVGILACGHVFHAECLEKVSPDISPDMLTKDDPLCPQCKQPTAKTFPMRFRHVKHSIQPLARQLSRVFKAKPSVKASEAKQGLSPSVFRERTGPLSRSLSKLQGVQKKVAGVPNLTIKSGAADS